jgi:hypothetical protein
MCEMDGRREPEQVSDLGDAHVGFAQQVLGGKTDIAVYRNGVWYEYLSASGTVSGAYWGPAGRYTDPGAVAVKLKSK